MLEVRVSIDARQADTRPRGWEHARDSEDKRESIIIFLSRWQRTIAFQMSRLPICQLWNRNVTRQGCTKMRIQDNKRFYKNIVRYFQKQESHMTPSNWSSSYPESHNQLVSIPLLAPRSLTDWPLSSPAAPPIRRRHRTTEGERSCQLIFNRYFISYRNQRWHPLQSSLYNHHDNQSIFRQLQSKLRSA